MGATNSQGKTQQMQKIKEFLADMLFWVCTGCLFFALGLQLAFTVLHQILSLVVDLVGMVCGSFYVSFLGFASLINQDWAEEKLEQAIRWTESKDE